MRIKNGRYDIGCHPADYSGKQVRCQNATTIGTHTNIAKIGCWLSWTVDMEDWDGNPFKKTQIGRMFACVENWEGSDRADPNVRIAVLALDSMGEFGMLRWVEPDKVTTISENPPAELLKWVTGDKFLEAAKDPSILLRLIEYGTMSGWFISGADGRIKEIKERRKLAQKKKKSMGARLLQVERIWESAEYYLTNWQANETDAYGADYCPCCQEWLVEDCEGCPISEHVQANFCQKTPYGELSASLGISSPTPIIMKRVEDEYRFLVEVAMSVSHKYREEVRK